MSKNMPSHHSGVLNNENSDLDEIISKTKCLELYKKMEECLVENNRNWVACQSHVYKHYYHLLYELLLG